MVHFKDIKVGNRYWFFDPTAGFVRGIVTHIYEPINQWHTRWDISVLNPNNGKYTGMQFRPKKGETTNGWFFETFDEMMKEFPNFYKDGWEALKSYMTFFFDERERDLQKKELAKSELKGC